MKREKTLRRSMSFGFLLAALVPVLIFAVVSHIRLRSNLEQNLDDRITSDLRNSNQCLDMVLDKYETILYDMCTDDVFVESVSELIQDKDDMSVNSSALRRELSHICNSNKGIEGITIFLNNGSVIFYDSLNSSSTNSLWADKIKMPEVGKGNFYEGITTPITAGDKQIYLFQISRRVVDYRDIHDTMGTAVISVNQEEISKALAAGLGSTAYLLEGGRVISSPRTSDIGKVFTGLKDSKENKYTEFKNDKSGFTICNEQSLSGYKAAILEQVEFLVVIAVISCIIVLLLILGLTKPYLFYVDSLVDAMNEVESANFDVNVEVDAGMPVEIRSIGNGFNEMVGHIDDLILQVKEAVVEQKNAELSALEAQIDPHFLYNTLDTINWKAIENEQYDISEMVGALADILRYSVKNAGGVTTVRQELRWLKQYCMLQGMKLGKPLNIDEKVPEDLMGYRIHKLLLQPFVENSIKYGFREQEGECCLTIELRRSDGQIHIIIEDNGSGIETETLRMLNDETQEMEGHMGVINVRRRLKLYYGDEATIYFESSPEKTKVHIFIPEKEETE